MGIKVNNFFHFFSPFFKKIKMALKNAILLMIIIFYYYTYILYILEYSQDVIECDI